MKADDQTLVRQSLQGDGAAFEALLERYEKPVFNAALRMVGSPDDAGDITQTVFLRAYENLDRFDASFRFFSWLYRIALNESLRFLDRRRPTEPIAREPVDARASPEDRVAEAEMSVQIQGALMRLSSDHRAVVVLRHFQEFTYREIADILEIPEKTVKSRLFAARRTLRDILVREDLV